MHSQHGRTTANVILGLGVLGLAVGGCEPVREDRTITWSANGEAVGFQHAEQGVFVADKQGKALKKVYQPDAGVIATSTPLWSPTDRRLIFTTARDASGRSRTRGLSLLPGIEPDPNGELFDRMPIVYTCWLRDETAGEAPVELFEAKCDHVGYVAANLAVRWHPNGDRVLFIDSVAGGKHTIFDYDLKSKKSRRVFPHDAPATRFRLGSPAVVTSLACSAVREPGRAQVTASGSAYPTRTTGGACLVLTRQRRPRRRRSWNDSARAAPRGPATAHGSPSSRGATRLDQCSRS